MSFDFWNLTPEQAERMALEEANASPVFRPPEPRSIEKWEPTRYTYKVPTELNKKAKRCRTRGRKRKEPLKRAA
ncbi:hypothetical protein [Pontibacter beigongshangensis]|uniref:hypothetical protein n=1 Tax=Pontibacter beigongshangensis TaxID=2574733 RepID=UPI00164FC7D2|nr:hypothetical protein [Pontibacter beigongshangensis]